MGQAQDDYQEQREQFLQVPEEKLRIQNGSTEQIIAYGDKVVELCSRKAALIIEEGANETLVNSVGERLNAFAVADMKSRMAIDTHIDKNALWRAGKSESLELRDLILSYADVAVEDEPELKEQLEEIKAGGGNANLIQDMLDISGFVRQNVNLFAQFPKFDMAWVEQAEQKFSELRDIRAMLDNPGETVAKLLLEERQAYTHLEESLKEISKFGRLALRGDEESLKLLTREYITSNIAKGIAAKAAKEAKEAEAAVAGASL